MISGSFFIC